MWMSWQTWYIIRQPERLYASTWSELSRRSNFDQQGLRHEATGNSTTTIIKCMYVRETYLHLNKDLLF